MINKQIKIDPSAFALAVVQSSSPNLSPKDKLSLYKSAFSIATDESSRSKSEASKASNDRFKSDSFSF